MTGGAGFVGSHLCDYLVQRGDDVSAPGRTTTGFLRRSPSRISVRRAGPRPTRPASGGSSFLSPPGPLADGVPPQHFSRPRGSHLSVYVGVFPAARARKTQVICLDNFFTGAKDNIKHLIGKPNFEVIRHDVVEPILLEVDQIYHLACPASPIHYK